MTLITGALNEVSIIRGPSPNIIKNFNCKLAFGLLCVHNFHKTFIYHEGFWILQEMDKDTVI